MTDRERRMKKQFLAVAALMFLFPLTASAGYIGSGEMAIGYSLPAAGGYYADYDVNTYVKADGAEIKFASYEAFCVEKEDLISPTLYKFYTSNGIGVDSQELLSNWAANYQEATWIANWATTTTTYNGISDQDVIKAYGQVAIWNLLHVLTIDGFPNINNLYQGANDKEAYVE
jgi:hypothetical protein